MFEILLIALFYDNLLFFVLNTCVIAWLNFCWRYHYVGNLFCFEVFCKWGVVLLGIEIFLHMRYSTLFANLLLKNWFCLNWFWANYMQGRSTLMVCKRRLLDIQVIAEFLANKKKLVIFLANSLVSKRKSYVDTNMENNKARKKSSLAWNHFTLVQIVKKVRKILLEIIVHKNI